MPVKHKKQGAVDVVRGRGPINAENVAELSAAISQSLGHGQPAVVLDLQAVSLLDSAALETLLELQAACQWRGGSLKLAAPSPLCRDVLAVTAIDELFEIFPDADAAVESFA